MLQLFQKQCKTSFCLSPAQLDLGGQSGWLAALAVSRRGLPLLALRKGPVLLAGSGVCQVCGHVAVVVRQLPPVHPGAADGRVKHLLACSTHQWYISTG